MVKEGGVRLSNIDCVIVGDCETATPVDDIVS